MNEVAIVLGRTGSLVGVLTLPDAAPDPARPAVIAVNAGLVHRIGPHRMHVALLRRMAGHGFVGLRFDFSGVGDSLPRADMLPYTQSTLEEVQVAMDAVTERTGVRQFCVLGLSSGALVALACAGVDERIVGVGMLNPHGFGVSSVWGEHVAAIHASRVYARNLLSLESWKKLFTGRTNYRRLVQSLRYRLGGAGEKSVELASVAQGARPELMAHFKRDLHTLMVFSQEDGSMRNMVEILGRGWKRRLGARTRVVEIAGANHTFASPPHLQQALLAAEQWLLRSWPAGAPARAGAAAIVTSPGVAAIPTGPGRQCPVNAANATAGGSHGL